MPSSTINSTDGLPERFVTAMQTLFNLLDTRHSGYIKLSEFTQKWIEATDQSQARNSQNRQANGISKSYTDLLPKNFLTCLHQVSSSDEMLTFERFCTALRLALSQQQQSQQNRRSFNGNMIRSAALGMQQTPTQQSVGFYGIQPSGYSESDRRPLLRPTISQSAFQSSFEHPNQHRSTDIDNPPLKIYTSEPGSADFRKSTAYEPIGIYSRNGSTSNGLAGYSFGSVNGDPHLILNEQVNRDEDGDYSYNNSHDGYNEGMVVRQQSRGKRQRQGYDRAAMVRHRSNPDLPTSTPQLQRHSQEVNREIRKVRNESTGDRKPKGEYFVFPTQPANNKTTSVQQQSPFNKKRGPNLGSKYDPGQFGQFMTNGDKYQSRDRNINTGSNMARISVDTSVARPATQGGNRPASANMKGTSRYKMSSQDNEIHQLLDDLRSVTMSGSAASSLSPADLTSSGVSSTQPSPRATAVPPNPPSGVFTGSDHARVAYAGLSTKPIPPTYSQTLDNINHPRANQSRPHGDHNRSYSTLSGDGGISATEILTGGRRVTSSTGPPHASLSGHWRHSNPNLANPKNEGETSFPVDKQGNGQNLLVGSGGKRGRHKAMRKSGSMHEEDHEFDYRAGLRTAKPMYVTDGRRNTVSEGSEQAINKHRSLVGEERELISRGMDFATRLRNWLDERSHALDNKLKIFDGSTLPKDYAVQEQRLNYFRVHVAELNRRIVALMESSEKNFPSQHDMQATFTAPQPSTNQVHWLQEQNIKLNMEVADKVKQIELLQQQKSTLNRQLISSRERAGSSFNPNKKVLLTQI